MIGEATALNTTLQSDRIFRENSGEEVARRENDGEVSQQSSVTATDTVTFSAEAVALATNVAPASESSETTDPSATERGEASEQQLADQRPSGEIDFFA